ncbi:hypothetical protein DFR44_10270 [Hydromonas duriensis]|uniref:Uncharacterized protein n=2 Tax=Hydromonas duriensis TaxID=1527608 RepID=A0A4R6YAX7_9BURK|nr:hypothetical protein DFR44_10270 [Hydromonas duriensis]
MCWRISHAELNLLREGVPLNCDIDLPLPMQFSMSVLALAHHQVLQLEHNQTNTATRIHLNLSPQGLAELIAQPQQPLRDFVPNHTTELVVEIDFKSQV